MVCFDGVEDLVEKISYYLNHEEERARIARNGRKKVEQYHSYYNRIEQILQILAEN